MRYNIILCSLSVFIFTILLSVVPCLAVTPDDNTCPPNPPSSGFSSFNSECVGTTVYYSTNNIYYCGYIASNYPVDYYGSFISTSYGSPQLRVYAYIRVGVGGVYDRTNITWQTIRCDTIAGGLTSLTSWTNRDWSYQYKTIETYNNNIQYLKVYLTCSLPANVDYDSYSYFNDTVQFLENDFSEYTDQDMFNLCLDFSHPAIIGEYDETIPSFTKCDFNFSNVIDDDISVVVAKYGVVSGQLQSLLSDGTQYSSNDYYIDYRSTITYNLSVIGGNEYNPTASLSRSVQYSHFDYNNTDLDISVFNNQFRDDLRLFCSDIKSSNKSRVVTANDIVYNVRLRRKSDGNYGNWLVIKANDTGISAWNSRELPVTNATSGIQYGSDPNETVTTIDSGLTEQSNINVNFTVDGSSLGSSIGGSRIYEGGGNHSSVDVGAITSTVKSVPQMFGVIFSFLPPEILMFISVAFVTLIAVAIVKAIT